MPNYKINLSRKAKIDLEEIYLYTTQSWGMIQARAYLDKIEDTFIRLIENPKLGKERPEIKSGYRSIPIKSHIVFYTLEKNTINILNILHRRMDIGNRLFSK